MIASNLDIVPPKVIQPMIDAALMSAHIALKRRQEPKMNAVAKIDDGQISLVSKGDIQSEQVSNAKLLAEKRSILEALKLPPETPLNFIMEESEHTHGNAGLKEKRRRGLNVVIDSIDGTLGYTYPHRNRDQHDRPSPWCISIGLELDGKPIAAVVYEASQNEWQIPAGVASSYGPNHPRGKIFWAERGTENAYRINAPPGGFTITPSDAARYQETDDSRLWDAEGLVRNLAVDYSQGLTTRLSTETAVQPLAPVDVGDFLVDRKAGDTENGLVARSLNDHILRLDERPERSLSAVASCMRVADGRANGFAHGCFFPWDESAARLILEKSGVRFVQYETPESDGKMSMLLMSRDPDMYRGLNDLLRHVLVAENIISANPPLAEGMAAENSAISSTGSTMDRRKFLQGAATAAVIAATPSIANAGGFGGKLMSFFGLRTQPASTCGCAEPHPTVHLKDLSLEQLYTLPDEQKILLAAGTASGCDAIAYYTPREGLSDMFDLNQHIEFYPGRDTPFEKNIFKRDDLFESFRDEEAVVRNNKDKYFIPVYAVDAKGRPTDTLKGIIALHPPADRFSALQEEPLKPGKDYKYSANEAPYIRLAKLRMAGHIVERHQDLFGDEWALRTKRGKHHRELAEKEGYFLELIKNMFDTFTKKDGNVLIDASPPVHAAKNAHDLKAALRQASFLYDSDQAPHLTSIADMMEIAVDTAVNKNGPLVSDGQKDLLVELAMLHDLGKAQMSSGFLRAWHVEDTEEEKKRDAYFHGYNHNHPLFTLLALLVYKNEAITAGAHHHGLFRYSSADLKEHLGRDFDRFHILKDNISPDQLPVASKIIHICDVAVSIVENAYADKPMHAALAEMAQKAGYKDGAVTPVKIEQGTIDPDLLCFLIDSGVFKSYAEKRAGEDKEWTVKKRPKKEGDFPIGAAKYDAAEIDNASRKILEAFHWAERKEAAEKKIRDAFAKDPVIVENAPGKAAAGSAASR